MTRIIFWGVVAGATFLMLGTGPAMYVALGAAWSVAFMLGLL